ncbi:hypothetical protein B0A52_09187 [Exophiala mesophila]|uniref:Inositol-pentakisphosphate 2-kinase n=1 Tax=Exophiala mesophila TaxID=212818 RepID=A0A438MTI5_EXOME|nr:hypothetical protein B0A52_09187 [Exophiala mesophila]
MPPPTSHQSTPTCPSSLVHAELQLQYLAEGAANVIYSVTSVAAPASQAHHMNCCVMRLRKDLPSTKPSRQVVDEFNTQIVPLFQHDSSLLLNHVLCKLTPQMVETLNRGLREMDRGRTAVGDDEPRIYFRHPHRRHVYLPSYDDEDHGILMQNLNGPGVRLVEFKPKWLVQSPSAPTGARNCRTCAMNAMRRHGGKFQGRGDSGFCPLDLLSSDDDVLRHALASIWPHANHGDDDDDDDDGLTAFLAEFRQRVQPALRHLAILQKKFNGVGLHDFRRPDGSDSHFAVAMALRDCSVFLSLGRRGPGVELEESEAVNIIDVKFADLDLKSVQGGKIDKWAAMEQQLIDEGWYHRVDDTNCAINR